MARTHRHQDEPANYDEDFVTWVEDLRGRMWRNQDGRRPNWGLVAADSGLCFGTVSRFAYRETKRPHAHTIFAIAKALGWVPSWKFGNEKPAPLGSLAIKKLPAKQPRKKAA